MTSYVATSPNVTKITTIENSTMKHLVRNTSSGNNTDHGSTKNNKTTATEDIKLNDNKVLLKTKHVYDETTRIISKAQNSSKNSTYE